MTDFHTHILPGIDDGSKDVKMSLEMLRLERDLGVDRVILTPHFYSDQNSPEQFLERRSKAWQILSSALEPDMPQLLLGAEVQYFEGIDRVEEISSLCIEDTNVLLLEMPFSHWDERTVHTVLDLSESGFQVVLAHIERYEKEQSAKTWNLLRENGILMQVNTSLFSGWFHSRRATAMLKKGKVHFIGTDCHSMGSRKPNWELVPEEAIELAESNIHRLFDDSILS